MASELETLLGSTIQTKTGNKATSEVLSDCEAIGIYFSAHWCPPCRQFTPHLAQIYTSLRSNGKKFEIVFVSSDKGQSEFDEYYGEQPWKAVPFTDRDRKKALSQKYKVSGIPTLVIIDSNGKTITTKGRSVVSNPERFPWIPPTLAESLGKGFVSSGSSGSIIDAASLKDKILALYFSAHWCPPCRGFTPHLVSTYKKMKERGVENFEIIFVSSDKDEASFKEYFGEMPWLALPFEQRGAKAELSDRFDISGIPSLVVIGPDDGSGNREVINSDARGLVGNDPEGLAFPWHPPLYTKLEDADFINTMPTLVILGEGCDDERIEELKGELESIAKVSREAKEDLGFAFGEPSDPLADRIRTLTKIGTPSEDGDILLLDVSDSGAFYQGKLDGSVADGVSKFFKDWKSKSLTRQQLQ